jgi:cytochrome b561
MTTTQVLTSHSATPERYHPALRAVHWITAILIVPMFVTGGWMKYFDPGHGPLKERLENLHESIGMTVWVLVLLRVLLRLATGAPKLPPSTPGSVRLLATLTQAAMYLVLVVQPIVGLADTNAWGYPLRWFGLFAVPAPNGQLPKPSAQALSDLHWWGGLALLLLLVLHIAGALNHALVRRDGVIRHMV